MAQWCPRDGPRDALGGLEMINGSPRGDLILT